MTGEELIEKLRNTPKDDTKAILCLLAHIKEDGLLDSLLGNFSGSNGIEITRGQADEIIRVLKDHGFHDSKEKAQELLTQAMKCLQADDPLTPEMQVVKEQAKQAIVAKNLELSHIINAYNAYEEWLAKKDWDRYQIQHVIVCLGLGTTLAGGTRMIVGNKFGKI